MSLIARLGRLLGGGAARVKGMTGASILGLCGLVIIWMAVLHSLSAEREQALQGAVQETSNLSRAFEEHIIRSLKAVDQTLLYIRESYERDPAAFDVSAWTRSTQALTDLTFQISLIDKNGIVIESNLMSGGARVDLSDREHFRVHRDSTEDRLFVSKPVLGRVSHKWSIQLTRKMIAADGSFDGVIVMSLDPQYLSRFYESVDLGRRGSVTLVGRDGIIRARATRDAGPQESDPAIGRSVTGGRLMAEFTAAPSGSYTAASSVDHVQRIVAYRAVRGYPLVVSVGVAQDEVLAVHVAHRRSYLVSAALVSVLMLLVTLLVLVRQRRLNHARELLRASEMAHVQKSRLFEITLEHMSQGIMMVDADRRVQVCNARAIAKLGLPTELMANHPRLDDVLRWQWAEDEFGRDGCAIPEDLRGFVLAGGMSAEPSTYERTRPDGTVIEVRSTPLEGGGFVRTYTDVTRIKENEVTLRSALVEADKAAKAKSEFLATISHEIRSPMSGLVGVVDLLRETELDRDQARMAAMVHGSAQTLLAVLNDILDFSKIEAGALSVVPQPTRLADLVAALVQPHAVEAARKGVHLDLRFDLAIPERVETDALRLGQILNNLLSNAVKFTSDGTIELAVDPLTDGANAMLRFTVADSGIGMDAEVMSRLFAPFMQADGSTTRIFGGTGLGLCISKRLAGLLGGALTVASRRDKGSVFTLLLPLVAAAGDDDPATGQAPQPELIYPSGRVLVADDDATNRWLSQRQLEKIGLRVDVACDGAAALDMLRIGRYDLLLTDCHMPRMDGVALAKAVRQEADTHLRLIPIIGLTADATAAQRARCHEAGMTEVALKPLGREAMARLVHSVLPASPQPGVDAGSDEPGVFDDSAFCELFEPGDADGLAWLGEFVEGLDAREAELAALAPPGAGHGGAIAAASHQLAGSSLCVGALRLGQAARRLEQAALESGPAGLAALFDELVEEAAAARGAIAAFAARAQPHRVG